MVAKKAKGKAKSKIPEIVIKDYKPNKKKRKLGFGELHAVRKRFMCEAYCNPFDFGIALRMGYHDGNDGILVAQKIVFKKQDAGSRVEPAIAFSDEQALALADAFANAKIIPRFAQERINQLEEQVKLLTEYKDDLRKLPEKKEG